MEHLVSIPLLLKRKRRLRDEVICTGSHSCHGLPSHTSLPWQLLLGFLGSFGLLEVAFFVNDVCTVLPQGGTKLGAGLAQGCWGFISC